MSKAGILTPQSQLLCVTMLPVGLRADVLVLPQLQQLQGPEELENIRAHSSHVTKDMTIGGRVLPFLQREWSHRRLTITSVYPTQF